MTNAPLDMGSEMEGLIDKTSSYDSTGDAIGYSIFFYAKNMYQKPKLHFLAIDKIVPSKETMRNGEYSYVNDFYAAIRKNEPKDSNAYQLFEWLTSDGGQALVNGLGYVGIRDVEKPLPAALSEENKSFSGEIPLLKGDVILADGEYLYGEIGIGVFDRRMQLQKFISHTASPDVDIFLECQSDSILRMQDTLSGKYGLYSLQDSKWICEPVYEEIVLTKNGYRMERAAQGDQADGDGKQIYSYDYADQKGKLVRPGVTGESRIIDASGDQVHKYYNEEQFAKRYPEILKRYGASEEDIIVLEVESVIARIRKGGMDHYFDMNGNLLLDFDTTNTNSTNGYEPTLRFVNDHLASLYVSSYDDQAGIYSVF